MVYKESCLFTYRVSFWSSLTFDTWVSMCTLKAKGKKIILSSHPIGFLHITIISDQLHPIKGVKTVNRLNLRSRESTVFSPLLHTRKTALSWTGKFSRFAKKRILSLLDIQGIISKMREESVPVLFKKGVMFSSSQTPGTWLFWELVLGTRSKC